MGKKSKKNATKQRGNAASNSNCSSNISSGPVGNEIPLYRKVQPDTFKTLVDELNPVLRFDGGQTWACMDDDSFYSPTFNESGEMVAQLAERMSIRQHGKPAECPLCFAPASLKCGKCKSVFYCGAECQKKHWKKCHKKACEPNPRQYHFDVNINDFRSLVGTDAFEGHEFIVIKPTEKLSSLEDICSTCLESADNIFDKVPGFGNDQIQANWVLNNTSHPISKAIQKHFGWTSGAHGIDTMEGYRHSEDIFVYNLMYDDNFIGQTDLAVSYYGDACFPWARDNKHVRGNLVIFKLLIKNKKRFERDLTGVRMMLDCSDDSDLQFQYELYPITKAEIAHMLQERRKAIEQGNYTRRQWRYKIRRVERRHEHNGKSIDLDLGF